ncbi:MAG: hypothetical protein IPL73_16075 [Candidatus Obscuribacter sp.]|nr:hypothetical protein [Candidatus Obscuribacter sp.]
MDKPGVKARKVAVDVLTRVDKTKAFSNLALDSALTKAKLDCVTVPLSPLLYRVFYAIKSI